MFDHGGDLQSAANQFGIPVSDWLDLSTGVNPEPWPVDRLDLPSLCQLPQHDDGLEEMAKAYYGGRHVVILAGSQMGIRWLPRLRSRCVVGVPSIGYREHALSWQQAGHVVREVEHQQIDASIDDLDVLVVINPNNPTGTRFSREQLLTWHERLRLRHGWLVVDEAFMDAEVTESLTADSHQPGLFVLRSFGKFFGLPGLRLGFAFCSDKFAGQLMQLIGPWPVSSLSRSIAKRALADQDWQQSMRRKLQQRSRRLIKAMTAAGLAPNGGSCLFQWVITPQAKRIHNSLARQAVLTRYFQRPGSLRFGIPPQSQWPRFNQALQSLELQQAK